MQSGGLSKDDAVDHCRSTQIFVWSRAMAGRSVLRAARCNGPAKVSTRGACPEILIPDFVAGWLVSEGSFWGTLSPKTPGIFRIAVGPAGRAGRPWPPKPAVSESVSALGLPPILRTHQRFLSAGYLDCKRIRRFLRCPLLSAHFPGSLQLLVARPANILNPRHSMPTGDSWAGGVKKQVPAMRFVKWSVDSPPGLRVHWFSEGGLRARVSFTNVSLSVSGLAGFPAAQPAIRAFAVSWLRCKAPVARFGSKEREGGLIYQPNVRLRTPTEFSRRATFMA